jgi:hypothetical protein
VRSGISLNAPACESSFGNSPLASAGICKNGFGGGRGLIPYVAEVFFAMAQEIIIALNTTKTPAKKTLREQHLADINPNFISAERFVFRSAQYSTWRRSEVWW